VKTYNDKANIEGFSLKKSKEHASVNLAITRYTCSHCNLMEEVPVHKIIRYARVCATCGDLYGGDIENCCFCNKKIRDLCRDACG
jgi:hypothetical protein